MATTIERDPFQDYGTTPRFADRETGSIAAGLLVCRLCDEVYRASRGHVCPLTGEAAPPPQAPPRCAAPDCPTPGDCPTGGCAYRDLYDETLLSYDEIVAREG